MASRPLVLLPSAAAADRARLGGGGARYTKPTPEEQGQRLSGRLEQIAASIREATAQSTGLDPERVVVFETIGSLTDLSKSAEKIEGLEWLAELDLPEADPSDGFENDADATSPLPRRLFAVMANQQAIDSVLGLWNSWCRQPDKRAERGLGPLKQVFVHLRDVRRWSVEDRLLDTRVREFWQDMLQYQREAIRFEVELWCRAAPERRRAAFRDLKRLVAASQGRCLAERAIPQILYHGVLVELPPEAIEETVNRILDRRYTDLLRCEEVMLFRPLSQASRPCRDAAPTPLELRKAPLPSLDEPVIALLDGLPLERHQALRDRLRLDDPDDLRARYTSPREQSHGTSMASLLIHGDASRPGPPLRRPIYARPIMVPVSVGPDDDDTVENLPEDQLLLDLIERAVRGIFEGEGEAPPSAVGTKIINLSIGNPWQPFFRELSPLARLLDWLAWRYRVLFVVSAGNNRDGLELGAAPDETPETARRTIQALVGARDMRRLISPAEAINVVTVGAAHADASEPGAPGLVDPLPGRRLPSPLNPVSGGFRRAVKPEVLFPGGRALYQRDRTGLKPPGTMSLPPETGNPPGVRVAAPGVRPGELNRYSYTQGTSNATALATRACGLIHEDLLSLRAEPGGERLTDEVLSVLTKALLVHGASWGDEAAVVDELFPTRAWQERRSLKRRLFGYGEVDLSRVLTCTNERITLLGWGTLERESAHEYRLPLPDSLASRTWRRRLTLTLAWFSPLNFRHRNYRQAAMYLDIPAPRVTEMLGAETREVGRAASKRGTVQHLIFEGQGAVPYAAGTTLPLKVNCREAAGKLTDEIPYALAVTMEVGLPQGTEVDIYEEVRTRIRPAIRPRP